MSDLPKRVHISEEGPREGFQFEKGAIPTARKVALIDALSQTGLDQIQVVSFVNPKAVPGMADAEAVVHGITPRSDARPILESGRRNADRFGARFPCSQLRTVPTLVQRKSANSGWLSCKRILIRRICAGFSLTGAKAKRDTRNLAFRLALYFFASANPAIMSLNRSAFISSLSILGSVLPASFSDPSSGRPAHLC